MGVSLPSVSVGWGLLDACGTERQGNGEKLPRTNLLPNARTGLRAASSVFPTFSFIKFYLTFLPKAMTREATTASFYRVEGTLLPRQSLTATAWLAANAQEFGARVTRLAHVALSLPFRVPGPLRDTETAARVAWSAVRGMSEDRLAELGREYYERFLEPRVAPVAKELIAASRARGHQVVLLSDSPRVLVERLPAYVGADVVIARDLEMRLGRATGRLVGSSVSGPGAVAWARSYCSEQRLDGTACFAYGTLMEDSFLLSAFGHPCAVTPDLGLRRIAQRLAWPIVEA